MSSPGVRRIAIVGTTVVGIAVVGTATASLEGLGSGVATVTNTADRCVSICGLWAGLWEALCRDVGVSAVAGRPAMPYHYHFVSTATYDEIVCLMWNE